MRQDISASMDQGDMKSAKNKASELLNLAVKQEIPSIERELRSQITETIGLILILSEE